MNMSRLNYHVEGSTILMIGSNVFTGPGYFTIDSGATIEIRQPGGIDSTIKVTGTKTLKNGSSYIFDGTVPQVTGSLLPDTIGNLTIIDTAGVTLSHNVVANGLVHLEYGTLSLGSNSMAVNGSVEMENGVFGEGGSPLTYGANTSLIYSGTQLQTINDIEFPSSSGPSNLTINNSQGVTLHASRAISGTLNFTSGKLIISGSTLRVNSVTNTDTSRYIVTNSIGSLILPSVGSAYKLFPVGISATYAPVSVGNTGTVDTIGVGVAEDLSKAEGGGRVKVKWAINENTPGGGIYRLRFGWMRSLEDSVFSTNRALYSKIFRLSDTTEAGTGTYIRQLTADPCYVARGGITALDTFIVGSFTSLTGLEEYTANIPAEFSLSQNYPNPFNPTTTLRYQIPVVSKVRIEIYDLLGRNVAILVDNVSEAGTFTISIDGSRLSSGIYFIQLKALPVDRGNQFVQTKKMILLK
jgi:hypothetical protein